MGGEREFGWNMADLSSEELIYSEDGKHVCRLSPYHPLSEITRSVFSGHAEPPQLSDIVNFLGSENVTFIVQNF